MTNIRYGYKGRHHKRMHFFFRTLPEKGGGGLPMPKFVGPFSPNYLEVLITIIVIMVIMILTEMAESTGNPGGVHKDGV